MRFRAPKRPQLPMDPMRLLILCLLISAFEIFAGAAIGNAMAVIFGFLPFAILGFSWWRSQKKALRERDSAVVSGGDTATRQVSVGGQSESDVRPAANPVEHQRTPQGDSRHYGRRSPDNGQGRSDNGHPASPQFPMPPQRFLTPTDLIKPPPRFEAVKPPKTWRDEIDEF